MVAKQWPDLSGNGNTATLVGDSFVSAVSNGHGANHYLTALEGTTAAAISFGSVQPTFTICSVTRYTGGTNRRILNGGGRNFLHGHHNGRTGVAYYGNGWKTPQGQNVSPNTDCARRLRSTHPRHAHVC